MTTHHHHHHQSHQHPVSTNEPTNHPTNQPIPPIAYINQRTNQPSNQPTNTLYQPIDQPIPPTPYINQRTNQPTQVCGGDAFKLFQPEELELLLCGNPTLDFLALERSTAVGPWRAFCVCVFVRICLSHTLCMCVGWLLERVLGLRTHPTNPPTHHKTQYEDGLDSDTPLVKWFWEVVHALDEDHKKKLLKFCTGESRGRPCGAGRGWGGAVLVGPVRRARGERGGGLIISSSAQRYYTHTHTTCHHHQQARTAPPSTGSAASSSSSRPTATTATGACVHARHTFRILECVPPSPLPIHSILWSPPPAAIRSLIPVPQPPPLPTQYIYIQAPLRPHLLCAPAPPALREQGEAGRPADGGHPRERGVRAQINESLGGRGGLHPSCMRVCVVWIYMNRGTGEGKGSVG